MIISRKILLSACVAFGFSASSAFSVMTISQSGTQFTFTFVPSQSTPLSAGFASYTHGTVGVDRIISWTGYNFKHDGVAVISNTLIDAMGAPVPDSRINILPFNSIDNSIVGFGNESSLPFTVAGGSVTIDSFDPIYTLPASSISGFSFGTTYDPGTTGTNGDLIPAVVPEPSSMICIAFGFMVVGLRRSRKVFST